MSRGLPSRARNLGGGHWPARLCSVGVPFRHIGLRVGPVPRCWLLGGTGRTQARDAGPPRPVPAIQRRSRPWRSLMHRSPPGVRARGALSVQPGSGYGHRAGWEGAAGSA